MRKNKTIAIIIMSIIILMSNNVAYGTAIQYTESDEEYTQTLSTITSQDKDYQYTVTKNGAYIVSYMGDEEELVIPYTIDGYKVVGMISECLACAPNLKKVTINENITYIYTDAFLNARKLETIEVSSSNTTYASDDGMLYSKDYTYFVTCPEGRKGKVKIKEGTTTICDYSFFNAESVTSIYIPASAGDIGVETFSNTASLESIEVASGNTKFVYDDGILYSYDKKEVIKCVDKRASCVSIASTVESIRDYAFYGCSSLPGPLNFPSGLTSIGEYAFANCTSLDGEIVLPDTLTTLGICAFYGCESIEGVTFSGGLSKIPDDCFGYCYGLKEIVIPNSISEIGERAFFKCTGVKEVKLGTGLTTINNWAFDYLESLEGNLVIPDSVRTIGDCAFGHSPNIDGYIVIGSGVTQIGASIIYNSNSAKGVIFRGSVPSIDDYAFTEPSIPYYYLEGKTGYEDEIKNKELYTYNATPTVTYIVNGEKYKSVKLQSYGLTVDEFDEPVIDNYTFNGWYYDEEYQEEYNFEDVIMRNTNVYAKLTYINSININLTELVIEQEKTQRLDFEYNLESGATFDDITWTSSNTDVATVESGVVTAVSEGTAVITASYKDVSDEITITVFKDKNQLSFSEEIMKVVIGDEQKIDINYHLLNNASYSDIVWSSSDENIATVSEGVVTGISEGTAIITASYDDVQAEIEVKVVKPNKLEILTDDFVIKQNKTQTIDIDYYFNDDATDENIVWSSSNSSVATVENGIVTAKIAGETTISASYGNVKDEISVTVVGRDVIDFEDDEINIVNTTDIYNLIYTFYSYDKTKEDIVWSSSNESVATIENGVLTIIGNGQTTITANLPDLTSAIKINVVDPNRLQFTNDTVQVEYRKDVDINLDIDYYFNDGGTLDDVIYESDNSDVIAVVENELVATGVGTANITATYKDVSDTIEIEVVSIDKLEFKDYGYIIKKGNSKALEYIFDSYEGDIDNVIIYSSNERIAKIESGNIVALEYGKAIITLKYNDMMAELPVIVTDEDYLLGDLDFNGVVNANDAAKALDIYKYEDGTDEELIVGDINFDGIINANDAALILDIYKYN